LKLEVLYFEGCPGSEEVLDVLLRMSRKKDSLPGSRR